MALKHRYRILLAATSMPLLISAILVLFTLLCINHALGQSITADGSLGTQVTLDNSNYSISAGTIRGGASLILRSKYHYN